MSRYTEDDWWCLYAIADALYATYMQRREQDPRTWMSRAEGIVERSKRECYFPPLGPRGSYSRGLYLPRGT